MRWFFAACLIVYIAFVVRLTLADPQAGRFAFSLADAIATRLSHGQMPWSQTEGLANVALFVPLGFLLVAVFGRPWLVLPLCALASVAIELSQREFLSTRVPDIADVQHNALGALVGVIAALPLLLQRKGGFESQTKAGIPTPRVRSALP